MRGEYPNIELLEYKAKVYLSKDEEFVEQSKDKMLDFEAIVFPQTWGSTALGFGGFGGQAMTRAYTTVIHEIRTDTYVVFFGSKAAYKVTDANENFLQDLKNHFLVSVNEAHGRY